MSTIGQPLWWQRGIVYQIYPRSFQDSDGDGVGDLPGITGRLDYLEWLGVDAIWISPFFPSPMADFGYDVSDYCDVEPLFGSLGDFDRLVAEAHARGLRVILDFVANHSSEEHPWFLESRASRENPKRDWYIWRDPAPNGGPPNNWLAAFGGSAWEWDDATGQYYLHSFLKEQPDLNWRNPEVEAAMHGVLRFWMERGVDGFRVDALRRLIKDEHFRDDLPNPDYHAGPGQDPWKALLHVHSLDRPEIHEVIARMRRVLDEYGERVMIGELYLPVERLVAYYGAEGEGCHLPFNFQLLELPWDARTLAAAIERYESLLPPHGWPNWVLGNHDRPRIASRVGAAQARIAAMLLLTLRGTPTMYYGDELGMQDVPIPPEQVQDPWEKNVPGLGLGRDPERTPMQWDSTGNAGFTDGESWLPLAEIHSSANVAVQRQDPTSPLTLYCRLIALRRSEPALEVGSYRSLKVPDDLLAYIREADDRRLLVMLNLGETTHTVALGEAQMNDRVLLSTHLDREGEPVRGVVEVRGDEGVVVELSGGGG